MEYWAEIWDVMDKYKRKIKKVNECINEETENEELSESNLLFSVMQKIHDIELQFLPIEQDC